MNNTTGMINKIKHDPKLVIISKIRSYNNRIITSVSTFKCKIRMYLNGITYGKNFKAKGKVMFFRSYGTKIQIGDNVTFNSLSRFNHRGINHVCILETNKNGYIEIGNNCSFSGVSIVSDVSIVIGNNVMCGANAMIADRDGHSDKYPQFKQMPVHIGDNVWIGMNCVIMKGVTIGENTIIGANSLVTKDIPANCIAAGSPCKVIKNREQSQ